MSDKNEEFNSTEIKIGEIKKSDQSDDWDIVSEFEVDTYQVPFISVPKMRDFDDGGAVGISVKRDCTEAQHVQYQGSNCTELKEHKQEDAAAYLHQQVNKCVRKVTETFMWEKSPKYKHGLEIQILQKEIHNAQELHEVVSKDSLLEKEMDRAMLDQLLPIPELQDSQKRVIVDETLQEMLVKCPENRKCEVLVKEIAETILDKQNRENKSSVLEVEDALVKKIEEAMLEKQPQEQQNRENESVGEVEEALVKEIKQAMHEKNPQKQQNRENEALVGEAEEALLKGIEEAMDETELQEQQNNEIESLVGEVDELMQKAIFQCQENRRSEHLMSEIEESMNEKTFQEQHKIRDDESLIREIEEAMKEICAVATNVKDEDSSEDID